MPKCNAFVNHMCVSLTGSWLPCCRFVEKQRYMIKDYTFDEYKKSNFFQELKTISKTSWSDGCIKCKLQEERSGHSYRSFFNDELSGKDRIEFIEISLSNECNLACKMCSPTYSTTWEKLIEQNSELTNLVHKNETTNFNIHEIFSKLDLTFLKKIKYLGGEPFITLKIKELFEYLENIGIIQNLIFECNTNCTLFPEKWLTHLAKFKQLEISLSIDGYGKLNDYIRHGKSWDVIEKNVIKWKEFSLKNPNVKLDIFTTIQAYNLHDIKNLKKFCNELDIKFTTSLLNQPNQLSINALPEEYLNEIKDEHNKDYYKSISINTDQFLKFKDFTKKLDKIHNNSYKTVIPQLEKYMEI